MNLVHKIEDKFFWIHNFLPLDVYTEIHNKIFKSHRMIKEQVKKEWQKGLIENLNSPKRFKIHDKFNETYVKLLREQSFVNLTQNKFYFSLHKLENGSGINWHNDGNYKYAATFYVNKRWNTHWGGEFMFTVQDEMGNVKQCSFVPIVGNTLIITKTPIFHKVNTVLSPVIPRFSIQCFIE